MEEPVRIDKYLWSARVFKTRSQATDACKKGKVLINKQIVKPSRDIRQNDNITVERDNLWHTYRVIKVLGVRVSAVIATDYIEDLTPKDLIDKHKAQMKVRYENRPFGLGRPTKKERRIIERFKNNDG